MSSFENLAFEYSAQNWPSSVFLPVIIQGLQSVFHCKGCTVCWWLLYMMCDSVSFWCRHVSSLSRLRKLHKCLHRRQMYVMFVSMVDHQRDHRYVIWREVSSYNNSLTFDLEHVRQLLAVIWSFLAYINTDDDDDDDVMTWIHGKWSLLHQLCISC